MLVKINGLPILPYDVDATTPALDQGTWPGLSAPPGLSNGCQFQNTTYNRGNQTSITLVPTPTSLAGALLDVNLVLIPQIGSSTIPDIAWNEYAEAIEQYVKWKACMGDKSAVYYDPGLGSAHKINWDSWAANLRTKARTGNVTPRMRTTPSDFA